MSEKLQNVTDKNFQTEVMENKKPVIVDVYADWCGPCKAISGIMEELNHEYADKLKVYKANVESNADTLSKYQVNGVPTILMFKNGELLDKHVGLRSKEDIKKDIKKVFNDG